MSRGRYAVSNGLLRRCTIGAICAAMVGTLGGLAFGSKSRSALTTGETLRAGESIRSPNGVYQLVMQRSGDLTELQENSVVEWRTGTSAHHGAVAQLSGAELLISSGGRRIWSSPRQLSHLRAVLRITDDGTLVLTSSWGATLWTNRLNDVCVHNRDAQRITVSLGHQRLWACAHQQLVMVTPVTTGAYRRGWGTPTGTWAVYSKQRDRHLRGPTWDDYVHYWMPFYGAYGFHDSTWQRFPYGSAEYATSGSHGCVHLPLAQMRRLYSWAHVGTVVTVESR